MGMLRTYQGMWRLGQGEDPGPEFDAAEEILTASLEQASADFTAPYYHASLRIERALHRMRGGKDPMDDLAAAEGDITSYTDLPAPQPKFLRMQGFLKTLRGMHRRRNGLDASADFDSAEEDFARAMAQHVVNPSASLWATDLLPVWTYRAKNRIQRGIHRLSRNEDPADDFAGAAEDLAEAIRFNKWDAEAWTESARLKFQRGLLLEWKGEPDRAQVEYRSAVADYAEALRLNPLLARQVGEELNEARGKVGAR
jgi:tetratricopeptide (TPR) repeat protein